MTLVNFMVCYALSSDKIIHTLGYPKRAHFGKNVTIPPDNRVTPLLNSTEKNETYCSESVVIDEMIIGDDTTFEVFSISDCN